MKTKFLSCFLALLTAASSATAVGALLLPPLTKANLRCDQRQVFAARQPNTSALAPGPLLELGMQGKSFPFPAPAALAAFDQRLVRYGLQFSLLRLLAGPERDAVTRIAYLLENNYVIAAQMAYGAAMRARVLSAHVGTIVGNMVNTATETVEDDAELAKIANSAKTAKSMLADLPEQPRAFALWVIQGYAFDDPVAVDAALAGFCMSDPSPAAIDQLLAAARRAYLGPKGKS